MILTFPQSSGELKRRYILLTVLGFLAIIGSLTLYILGSQTINTTALFWICSTGVFIILLSVLKVTTRRKFNMIILFSGLLITVLFLFLMLFATNPSDTVQLQAGLSFGIILLLIATVMFWKSPDSEIVDERTKKIGAYGISCSWYVTYLIVIMLFWVTYAGIISIKANTLFMILILVMPVSAAVFRWYYSVKGEVC